MDKKVITTDRVAPPSGTYSHAIQVGNLLFVAGQVALDHNRNLVGKGDSAAQTKQCMENIQALLEAAGATWENVVKLNIFVLNMADRAVMGEARLPFLKQPYPTSTLVEVKQLANPDFLVEIEAVAAL